MTRAEYMTFDLTSTYKPTPEEALELGFSRIFSSEEIAVTPDLSNAPTCIVASSDQGILDRAQKRPNVAGIIINDSELLRMTLEKLRENEKILVLPLHQITCTESRQRLRNIYRMRSLLGSAFRYDADVAVATLAESKACLLSSRQMVEICLFLGASSEQADVMVSRLGELQ